MMMHCQKTKQRLPLWLGVAALAFAGTALGAWIAQTNPSTKARESGATVPSGIERSQVCFINDRYMGKPQIPVSVEGKTYYGCCQGCAACGRTVFYTLRQRPSYGGGSGQGSGIHCRRSARRGAGTLLRVGGYVRGTPSKHRMNRRGDSRAVADWRHGSRAEGVLTGPALQGENLL